MYGLPVRFSEIDLPGVLELDEHEKTKMILIDCLINCSIFLKAKGQGSQEDIAPVLNDIIKSIGDFYGQVHALETNIDPLHAKSNEVEYLIDRTVDSSKRWNKNFWTSYFQNSLLFLDIIYFSRWLQHSDMQRFNREKEDIYFLIIKIIAASANANSQIEKEEEMLFKNFLDSTKMKEEKVKMANDYFFKGITIDSIDFSEIDSWIVKKYLLEISILTIWSDRLLEYSEKQSLLALTEKLGFSELELEESLLAIESFVLTNWEKIPYKNGKDDFETVSDNLTNRSSQAIAKRLKLSGKTFPKTEQYETLINRSTAEGLAAADKKALKNYLLEFVKEIPKLAIFLLPGGSIL